MASNSCDQCLLLARFSALTGAFRAATGFDRLAVCGGIRGEELFVE